MDFKTLLLFSLFLCIKTKFPLFILFSLIFYFAYKLLRWNLQARWHIDDLQIQTFFQRYTTFSWCLIYIIFFVLFFFIWRMTHLKHQYDLVLTFYTIVDWWIINDTTIVILQILLASSLLLLFITLIISLKQILFKSFLRHHYYAMFLRSKENKETFYSKTIIILEKIHYITNFPYYLLRFFIKEKNPHTYGSSTYKLSRTSQKLAPYWGLFTVSFCITYDIFFNKCMLHKIFLLLPLVFFYQLCLIIKSFILKAKTFEDDIYCYFYVPLKEFDTDSFIYDNDHITTTKTMADIYRYIENKLEPRSKTKES